jgi:predicted regulator of Ras-like GTPase activity (Roadblock/LC7/MglB family)
MAMAVGASDGLIVEAGDARVAPEEGALRRHTAALAAYLYSTAGRASAAAGLGDPDFMRLEAAQGQLCVVGAGEVVVVALLERGANLGRIRLDMLTGARNIK